MQRFTLLIAPEDGVAHPADHALMTQSGVRRVALLHTDLLPDGTAVVVCQLDGDPAAASEALDAEPTVLSYDVSPPEDGRFHVTNHLAATGSMVRLLGLVADHAVETVPPFEYTDDGLRVTLVGTQRHISTVMNAVPDDLVVRFGSVDSHEGGHDELITQLTERQHAVLAAAVEIGYYETPRRVTQADIAESMGSSTNTVGEHLRKAEAKVLSELMA